MKLARRMAHHVHRYGLRSLIEHSSRFVWGSVKRAVLRPVQGLRTRAEFLVATFRLRFDRPRLEATDDPRLIVCLTSFPARIRTVWATVETLFSQTLKPDAVILCLSTEEFPRHRVPWSLRRLERRGMMILWTEKNIGSYKKLLPARRAFPDAVIVTVDDDALYSPEMLEVLVERSADHPGSIIGHRGWDPLRTEQGLRPYVEWMRANRSGRKAGPDSDPNTVFLTGLGGVLYPPDTPPDALMLQESLALDLAPTADDVWFWGCAIASGAKRFCTGMRYHTSNGLEDLSPALFSQNKSSNDVQIAAVVTHFRLEQHF